MAKRDFRQIWALERYIEAELLLIEVERKVREVLNSAGVPMIVYSYYFDFGREVWARKRRLGGRSLAREVEVLITKWVLRGLSREVLEWVRDEALSVDVPSRP
ncbi:MAG: hypothetical protein ACUVUD_06170 [bacterium]